MGTHIEQMWMVFGTLAMMLLLINAPKNALTLFAIIILGTFVADEEFLLEVAAIAKGENLLDIRESRSFEPLPVASTKKTEKALTEKLKVLLESGKSPEEIIQHLEESRIALEIKGDIPGLEAVDKDIISMFAKMGPMHNSALLEAMLQKGYVEDAIITSFEMLGVADYISNTTNNVHKSQLTKKGVALAQALEGTPK